MTGKIAYVPAFHVHGLTQFYDPIVRLVMGGTMDRLVDSINLSSEGSLLDIGCGPAELLFRIAQRHPNCHLTGLDIDPGILEVARKKIVGKPITLVQGSATQLPFPDSHFDSIVSSLAFHHLTTLQKEQAFAEAFRVLKPGGKFHLFDFGPPPSFPARILAALYGLFEEISDGVKGRLPGMYRRAGFTDIMTHWHAYGIISLFSGIKP